jgi:hypothetical protein
MGSNGPVNLMICFLILISIMNNTAASCWEVDPDKLKKQFHALHISNHSFALNTYCPSDIGTSA